MEHIVERHIIFEEKVYADIYLGTMLIRGENVCLFGEVDPERQDGLREAGIRNSFSLNKKRRYIYNNSNNNSKQ